MAALEDKERTQRWVPIESNPTVLNKYIHNLGVDEKWQFVDVLGLDPDLLMMVPRPVSAIVLLFPDNREKIESITIGDEQDDYPGSLYYTKQTIGNACGTVAIVHCLANSDNVISLDKSKHFATFLEKTKSMNPEERAKHLEKDLLMGAAHGNCAQEGDTQAPSQNDHVKSHFVAFVNYEGILYELDGRRKSPVTHGKTSSDSFLEDAAVVLKAFMDRDPDDVGFNVMALAKCDDM